MRYNVGSADLLWRDRICKTLGENKIQNTDLLVLWCSVLGLRNLVDNSMYNIEKATERLQMNEMQCM